MWNRRRCARSRSPTTLAEVSPTPLRVRIVANLSSGGAANAYIPTVEEEEHEKRIQEQEAELMRVRTLSKERVKEIEHERQELRRDSPAS